MSTGTHCGKGHPHEGNRARTRNGVPYCRACHRESAERQRRARGAKPRRPAHLWVEEDRGYTTPCWIWQMHLDEHGYGHFHARSAHRAIYEELTGTLVPEHLHVDHLCRVHACVNPAHLEPVTPAENSRRSPRCKLTLEDARVIRASAASCRALGRHYGVTHRMISLIRRDLAWREEDAA